MITISRHPITHSTTYLFTLIFTFFQLMIVSPCFVRSIGKAKSADFHCGYRIKPVHIELLDWLWAGVIYVFQNNTKTNTYRALINIQTVQSLVCLGCCEVVAFLSFMLVICVLSRAGFWIWIWIWSVWPSLVSWLVYQSVCQTVGLL